MLIQQVAYDIPNDIALGIVNGIYKRFGRVVRDVNTGAIVKHLKEIPVPEKKSGNGVLQAVKNHPVLDIGVGLIVTEGTVGTAYYASMRAERESKKDSPKSIVVLTRSLRNILKLFAGKDYRKKMSMVY